MKTLVGMCLTSRHDFLLLDEEQKENVRRTVRPLYDHHVKPLAEENATLRARAEKAETELAELWDWKMRLEEFSRGSCTINELCHAVNTAPGEAMECKLQPGGEG